uniref:hypothetical protein n=1 Tax=Agathobacter sp. TaxID=2021311 RepID=UPI00405681B1
MKKRTIITVCVSLAIILLVGSALLVSYNKFGTVNIFSAVSGYIRVMNTDAQAVTIQENPQIMIADPDMELLDRHMDTLGYERVDEKQLGGLIVFSNGTDEQRIMYSQNKYYSLWKWQE